MSKLYSLYKNLKKEDDKIIYLFKSGIFYIAIADDAIYLSNQLGFKLTHLNNSIVKCGFPISSVDKYIKIFSSHNINFKFVDNTSNTIYLPEEFKLNYIMQDIINSIQNIDTENLSVAEAYQYIENLKEKANTIKYL